MTARAIQLQNHTVQFSTNRGRAFAHVKNIWEGDTQHSLLNQFGKLEELNWGTIEIRYLCRK